MKHLQNKLHKSNSNPNPKPQKEKDYFFIFQKMKRERRSRAGHSSGGASSHGYCLAHELVDEQHDPVLVVGGEARDSDRDDIVRLDSAGEEFVMEFALRLDGRDVDFFFIGGGGEGAAVDGAEEDGLLEGEFAEEDG